MFQALAVLSKPQFLRSTLQKPWFLAFLQENPVPCRLKGSGTENDVNRRYGKA
jgi:hypothetical protein